MWETSRLAKGLDRKEEKNFGGDRAPVGVIDVVHGAINPSEVAAQSVRTQRKMATHLKEVYQMGTEPTFVKKAGEVKGEISFLDEDLLDVVQPHNDALVLTLRVQEYNVRRILIDMRSSSEIMYIEMFKKLGLKQSLRPTTIPLFGFSG